MIATVCIVTRGDVDLGPVLDSLPESWPLIVWDNQDAPSDLCVYGRYAAIRQAKTEIVYVQDDDCVLEPSSFEGLIRQYEPGVLTTNMPERFRAYYSDSCLIGFGAIFDKALTDIAFAKMPSVPPDFDRTCDVYFTTLTINQRWLDLPYRNLPWAEDATRMYRQPQHVGERQAALVMARAYR